MCLVFRESCLKDHLDYKCIVSHIWCKEWLTQALLWKIEVIAITNVIIRYQKPSEFDSRSKLFFIEKLVFVAMGFFHHNDIALNAQWEDGLLSLNVETLTSSQLHTELRGSNPSQTQLHFLFGFFSKNYVLDEKKSNSETILLLLSLKLSLYYDRLYNIKYPIAWLKKFSMLF